MFGMDVCADLMYASCREYRFFVPGGVYLCCCHEITSTSHVDFQWFCFGLNSNGTWNSNRCMLRSLMFRRFIRLHRCYFGLFATPSITFGTAYTGTVFPPMGNTWQMHLSISVVPSTTFTATLRTNLSQIQTFRSPSSGVTGTVTWTLIAYLPTVLKVGDWRCLMRKLHLGFK